MYGFVENNPISSVDFLGLLNWRNAQDVWQIQTILNNNANMLSINLGSSGPGNNGIDGEYGPKTKEAVCLLQSHLIRNGLLGEEEIDGLWGSKTDSAFEAAENQAIVNWRWAHIRFGFFFGGSFNVGSDDVTIGDIEVPDFGIGAGGLVGFHANMLTSNAVSGITPAAITRGSEITGRVFEVGGQVAFVAAWNIFNAEDWRQLSGTNTSSNIALELGPLDRKLANIFKKSKKANVLYKAGRTYISQKANFEELIDAVSKVAGGSLWGGVPQSNALILQKGAGIGEWTSLDTNNYYTLDFGFGN